MKKLVMVMLVMLLAVGGLLVDKPNKAEAAAVKGATYAGTPYSTNWPYGGIVSGQNLTFITRTASYWNFKSSSGTIDAWFKTQSTGWRSLMAYLERWNGSSWVVVGHTGKDSSYGHDLGTYSSGYDLLVRFTREYNSSTLYSNEAYRVRLENPNAPNNAGDTYITWTY